MPWVVSPRACWLCLPPQCPEVGEHRPADAGQRGIDRFGRVGLWDQAAATRPDLRTGQRRKPRAPRAVRPRAPQRGEREAFGPEPAPRPRGSPLALLGRCRAGRYRDRRWPAWATSPGSQRALGSSVTRPRSWA
jgi:hypothetical protein